MPATTVITEVVAILGVLGVGSILGQYIGSSKDRREARAGVLTALADAESSRWVGPDAKTLDEFHSSMRKLQTAALIARLPRDAVEQYAVLGQAARWYSQTAWEQNPDPETGGRVEEHLAKAVEEAARAVAAIAWSPGLGRTWRWRRARKRVDEHLNNSTSKRTLNLVKRSRENGFL